MQITRSYRIGLMLCAAMAIIFSLDTLRSRATLEENAIAAAIYAYPLVLMEVTQRSMTDNGTYQNTCINAPSFPTDTFNQIVRPNVDTLYSFAWLDLNKEPLVLNAPALIDRYYIIECLDAWTNVFASLGTRTTGTEAHQFLIAGPEWKGETPKDLTLITAPTTMVLLLARTHTHGPADYEYIHTIQNNYALTPLNTWKSGIRISPLALNKAMIALKAQVAPVDQVARMDAREFYTTFLKAYEHNPAPLSDTPILHILRNLGVIPGVDGHPSALFEKKRILLDSSLKKALLVIAQKKDSIPTTHGWAIMRNIGTYGTDYHTRAYVAFIGIGANLPADALYPTTFVDSTGEQLTGKHAYYLHFEPHQLPPAHAFWSLTLYNNKSFLAANIINRYSLNNRDPLIFNPDGSLDLYIQHESPGEQQEHNWLPAPEGEINLSLRLYWPKKEALDGTWEPPAVEKRR